MKHPDRTEKIGRSRHARLVRATLLGLLAAGLAPAGALASTPFDAGVNPSTSSGQGGLVEVHQAYDVEHGSGIYTRLWYSVGTPQFPTNTGSVSSVVNWSAAYAYDNGVNPSVASGGVPTPPPTLGSAAAVVEVHQASVGSPSSQVALWYHVGTPCGGSSCNSGPIAWGASHIYDTGLNPSVALDPVGYGSIVEVHQGQGNALWYRVGQVSLSNDTISWGPSRQFDWGYHPNVAVYGDTVVEVHQASQTDPSALWYSVGTLQTQTMTISWGPAYHYDNGSSPAIAFVDGSDVKEVHQGAPGAVWTDIGTRSGSTINFGQPQNYDSGAHPGVDIFGGCEGGSSVEVQQAGNTLTYDAYLTACPPPK